MKKLLTAQAGVTILEGVIALGLLALITGGAFGVLLSASRSSSQPDIREEMALAVEKVHHQLQLYTFDQNLELKTWITGGDTNYLPGTMQSGLCDNDTSPLDMGMHYIDCMLPPICDMGNNSSFTYEVSRGDEAVPLDPGTNDDNSQIEKGLAPGVFRVKYTIQCNGYEL